MPVHPLTPFAHQKRHAPYTFNGALVTPVRSKSGLATSNRYGMVHMVDAADGVAALLAHGRIQYAARWLCSGRGATNAVLITDPEPYGPVCERCLDAKAGPTVYRCYDAQRRLLWIGSTKRFQQRIQSLPHDYDRRNWWHEVVDIQPERYPTISLARAAETRAIRAENPLYNKRRAA